MPYKAIAATIGALVIAGCVAVAVAVGSASRVSEPRTSGTGSPSATPTTKPASPAALLASLHIEPAPNAADVAPDSPILVKAGVGRLAGVQVTSGNGVPVAGALTATAGEWRSFGRLAYSTEYHVSATVTDGSKSRTTTTTTFRTVSPAATLSTAVFPNSGLEVGVGQPIEFRFSRDVVGDAARQSLIGHLSITESRPVSGGWHWFSNRELHFRPKKFWPTGEQLTVQWDLTGWNAGNGAWGQGAGRSVFGIGDARISYADLSTHLMTVTDNGRTVAVYPISGGKPTDPTMGGVHIVLDRESVVHMVSSTNGVPVNSPDGYDELVYSDVHISDTGEYVHAAPWSVSSQGRTNISHGCINLNNANAKSFFDFSRVGDVVVVSGSPRPPVFGDHGVMDWDTGWSQFAPSGMNLTPPSGIPPLY